MRVVLAIALVGCALGVCAAQDVPPQPPPKTAVPPKVKRVITNDDIPPSPEAEKPARNDDAARSSDANAKPSADEMRAQIRKQRLKVADADAKLKQLKHLGEILPKSDCRNLYYPDDPSRDVCKDVAKFPDELKMAESRSAKEHAALEALQERARKLGYHSTVWDPE